MSKECYKLKVFRFKLAYSTYLGKIFVPKMIYVNFFFLQKLRQKKFYSCLYSQGFYRGVCLYQSLCIPKNVSFLLFLPKNMEICSSSWLLKLFSDLRSDKNIQNPICKTPRTLLDITRSLFGFIRCSDLC